MPASLLQHTRSLLTAALLSAFLGACSNGGGDLSLSALQEQRILDFESYTWEELIAGPRWEPRAGLQALELNDQFYVFGGRTPRPPMLPNPVPGDSDIWSDVWVSPDRGVTWEEILETDGDHWAPRAYFKAVTKDGWLYLAGGQDYLLVEQPQCAGQPPNRCPPFVSESNFFNDVWRSRDGITWEMMTADAGWAPRAGLSMAVLNGEIYVVGGSVNDDDILTGGPPIREYFNDVWKSTDGREWIQVAANAPWEARAGGVLVTRGDYLYLLGGEDGFFCLPIGNCDLPYYNDVWRSSDGANWELVTSSAGWSPRPGHQCGVIRDQFVCFGGFGFPENPTDVWTSEDGAEWTLLTTPPWNARTGEDIKYDFDIIVTNADDLEPVPAIYTFGGDRETFNFSDPLNYLRIDDDIWRFSLP